MSIKRLIQLLGMTDSQHDSEALNAIRLANKLLKEANVTWEQLLNAATSHSAAQSQQAQAKPKRETWHSDWNTIAIDILEKYPNKVSPWERSFLEGWTINTFEPTAKQYAVFERLADKFNIELPY
jgi:hypothetical protein